MSELALRLIEENKKTRAIFLDLGNCGLTEVPDEIGDLIWLEELTFSSGWYDWNGREVGGRHTKNTGSENKILKLTTQLSRCINLKKLWLIGGAHKPFPPIDISPLSELKNLQLLDIPRTHVKDLSHLGGLINLRRLEIHETPISDLTPLAELKNLQWLKASQTQVSDLTPLAGLLNLRWLDLSRTLVSDLAALAGLVNLQMLRIQETRVSSIAPLLPLIKKGLPVNSSTHAWGNNGIYVWNCPLTTPSLEITQQGSEAILRYFAEERRLKRHPTEHIWEAKTHESYASAVGSANSSSSASGIASVTIKVRETKLLIVGQGEAGKTTLRRKLENPNAPMPEASDTTRGIEITRLDEKTPQTGKPLRINVWDFGGQDIQYYAHQFFLTGNSLYALITNERNQDSEYLSYWLNIIGMLGKKSPILLIQNKKGGHCNPLKREAAIREQFSNVHNRVFQTNLSQAATEPEFADLRQEIVHQAAQLPHVEREYLASFAELRDKLEVEADRETHYLRWEAYLALMPELPEDLMRDYANALTFLGVCQYFPDDAMLSEFVFLRPKWIIDALFALLLHPSLEAKRGHFSEKDTFQIWQGTEYKGMHAMLVRMMKQFELCYRVEGDDETYILPQRLPGENRSYGWDELGDTPVQYKYKFMPKGILTRLICRLHPRIEADPERGQRVWCDAVIFALPDGKGRVFAREVYSENIIELRAAGDKRAEMLNEVIRKMDDINHDAKYDNLQVEKLVPCPCEVCQNGEKKHFFDFQLLVDLLEEGETEERCHVSRRKQNIAEVLRFSGVEYRLHRNDMRYAGRFAYDDTKTNPKPSTLPRIFISYSKDDAAHKANLLKHLSGLRGKMVTWDDKNLLPGEEWDERIKAELRQADVVLYLVSHHSMATNYIQEVELPLVEERCRTGQCVLIPVIVDFCLWTELEFAKLNALPEKGVPVTDTSRWVNENQAWLDVLQGVKRIVEAAEIRV